MVLASRFEELEIWQEARALNRIIWGEFEECREALYWLRLADKGKIVSSEEMAPVREQCERIVRILTSIVKTARAGKHQSKIKNSGAKRKITTGGGAYHNGRGQVIGANQESKIL